MKYVVFLLAAGMLSITAKAQDHFYLSASSGLSLANLHNNMNYTDPVTQGSVATYNINLGVGYQYKHWRLQTGIQYLETGYKLGHMDINPITGIGFWSENDDYRITFRHLGIPLQLGYVINLGNGFTLVPEIGALTTYNFNARSEIKIVNGGENSHTWTGDDFKNRYRTISLWGNAGAHLEYKLNNTFSVMAGPSVQYMLTNFAVPDGIKEHNYDFNFDIGFKVDL